jgi:predicted unusual protein kinase regulating ubiquinone biosynthesis (AarF/ABC1/UbiB family)
MADDALRRVDALIQVGMRLASSAPSGRVSLARAARAIDPTWIPRPWGDGIAAELERARATAAQPIEFNHIERALREAWGVRPSKELDELDPEPAAVTPTSQVHRASLHGSPVAVKVLRPGLRSSVRQDLALLEGLLLPLRAAFPALGAAAILAEVRERTLDELDLEHEAMMQRRFHRALRGHPFLIVPAPVTRLAHEGVLVSEWIEGVPLWEAPERDRACWRLVRFTLGSMRSGIAHADPDPDDVLVRRDGRVAILDFGASCTVDPRRVELVARALDGVAAHDSIAFSRSLDQLGWLPSSHCPAALKLAVETLGSLAGRGATRLDAAAVIEARDRLLHRSAELTGLIDAAAIPPEDLWPLRAATQVFSVIARIGATGPWLELARDALSTGWGN